MNYQYKSGPDIIAGDILKYSYSNKENMPWFNGSKEFTKTLLGITICDIWKGRVKRCMQDRQTAYHNIVKKELTDPQLPEGSVVSR